MRFIVRSSRVDDDLLAIWQYVAKDDPAAADRLLDAIERRRQQLAVHPWSGMARDDIMPGLRQLVAGRYLILYRVTDETVDIVRVLHGRRRIDERAVENGR